MTLATKFLNFSDLHNFRSVFPSKVVSNVSKLKRLFSRTQLYMFQVDSNERLSGARIFLMQVFYSLDIIYHFLAENSFIDFFHVNLFNCPKNFNMPNHLRNQKPNNMCISH